MRWNQILSESLSKYRPMFTSLYADGKVPREVEMKIQKIERIMKREDRVIWMLRWYRIDLAFQIVSEIAVEKQVQVDQLEPQDRRILDRAKRDLAPKGVQVSDAQALNEAQYAADYLDDFEHWFGMPIESIKRFVFDRQMPSDVTNEFKGMEDDWRTNLEQNGLQPEHGDEIYLDFHNGWAWWLLDRPYCRKEGDAMGHCGNSASYDSGDRLLSLRQLLHEDYWEPHLTFILDDSGYLGEMKGKANEKPVERYHAMIVKLLESDIVFGLKGGGYAPENNFSLDDLSSEEVQRLKKLKPGFRSLSEIIKDGDLETVEKVIKTRMGARGWGFNSIDVKKQEVVIDHWGSLENFCNRSVDNYNETFNDIRDELYRIAGNDKDADAVYEEFYNDYYAQILENHIYDFNDYKADVGFDWNGFGPVNMTISFGSLEDALDDDENSDLRSGDDLDAIREYSDFGDRDPSFEDDIDEAVCHLVAREGKFTVQGAADIIYRTYMREGGQMHSNGSPTTNDPRQMRFDF